MLMSVKLTLTLVMRMLIVPILREVSNVIAGFLTLVMDSLVYVSKISVKMLSLSDVRLFNHSGNDAHDS